MKGVLKCLEVGVLLTENDEEFENHNQIYKRNGEDSKYGYYDEDRAVYTEVEFNEAVEQARRYVEKGVDMTYAIITNQGVCHYNENNVRNYDTENFTYDAEDVEFCIAKIDGEIVENWI